MKLQDLHDPKVSMSIDSNDGLFEFQIHDKDDDGYSMSATLARTEAVNLFNFLKRNLEL